MMMMMMLAALLVAVGDVVISVVAVPDISGLYSRWSTGRDKSWTQEIVIGSDCSRETLFDNWREHSVCVLGIFVKVM